MKVKVKVFQTTSKKILCRLMSMAILFVASSFHGHAKDLPPTSWESEEAKYGSLISQSFWYHSKRCKGAIRTSPTQSSKAIEVSDSLQITIERLIPGGRNERAFFKVRLAGTDDVGYLYAGDNLGQEIEEPGVAKVSGVNCVSKSEVTSGPASPETSFPLASNDVRLFELFTLGRTRVQELSAMTNWPMEIKSSGLIDDREYSPNGKDVVPLSFSSFEYNKQDFEAVYFEDVLVELRVVSSKLVRSVSQPMSKSLEGAFDAKYRPLKTYTRTFTSSVTRDTHRYRTWSGTKDAFEIMMLTKRKEVLVDFDSCLNVMTRGIEMMSGYAQVDLLSRAKLVCSKSTDNVPKTFVSYRYRPGLDKALSVLDAIQEKYQTKTYGTPLKIKDF